MFPIFKLVGAHVKPATFHFTQAYITTAYPEFSFSKTHGCAAITAASALVKHQRAMLCFQFIDKINCRLFCYDSFCCHIFE